ncbi:MAG: DUF4139 domain-containing protein, partial [Gammaproteobacteria bacterium]|nr:DUF4139 domain-containing protein [Gammaproteobacteria bacterium]MCW8959612.1 DUF4139 domain-containing protein [Gammaproteobacteria bacterium]
ATFDLTYQLGNASWSPSYDAALDTETGEVTLTQAAHVRQRSGESWERAKVTVSTARPSTGAAMPELHPWWIDFQQPPAPLLRESRAKTLQDNEMLAGAMAPEGEPAEMSQAQTLTSDFSVRYAIPGRVTIPADNSKHRFVLNRQTLKTELQARSAPRLDRRAFLYAELDYQGEAPLLPGPWQLQRDGTFVGSQHNPALRPGETIALAFGADDAIAIDYQQLSDERGKQGLINRAQNVQRSYRITVTSHHTRKLPVSIFDQLPVSRDESIKVSLTKGSTPPSGRDVNDRPGVLEWTRTLEANEGWIIDFGYQVSYPQDEKVPGF